MNRKPPPIRDAVNSLYFDARCNVYEAIQRLCTHGELIERFGYDDLLATMHALRDELEEEVVRP